MSASAFSKTTILATVLALSVITFGAYVRLSHAGLSCPDWPGCYGRLVVPEDSSAIEQANSAFPERPVDVSRAWKEMVHRYLAGALGLLILSLAVVAWRRRRAPGQRLMLPIVLLLLVIAQALLGMWTVTLLLKPLVVTLHLLGGVTIAAMLWWLALRHGGMFGGFERPLLSANIDKLAPWLFGAVLLLYGQIFLGGWTSSNYAALACVDFPTCQGVWVPTLVLEEAFTLWRGLGVDYEGGVLATDARVTIHFVHRLGALVVLAYLGIIAHRLITGAHEVRVRRVGMVMLALLILQIGLGVSNVLLSLPLAVAVAHNGVAVLLLFSVITAYHILRPPQAVV